MTAGLCGTGAHSSNRKASLNLSRAVWMVLLMPLALTWGCSGVVSGSSAQATTAPQTFGISGTISPAAGGSGTTVTLSGSAVATATADASGNYSFGALANGTYTVNPSRAGYTFTPATQTITISGSNVTGVNFAAAAQGQTFSV